jgi:hypothetical protein
MPAQKDEVKHPAAADLRPLVPTRSAGQRVTQVWGSSRIAVARGLRRGALLIAAAGLIACGSGGGDSSTVADSDGQEVVVASAEEVKALLVEQPVAAGTTAAGVPDVDESVPSASEANPSDTVTKGTLVSWPRNPIRHSFLVRAEFKNESVSAIAAAMVTQDAWAGRMIRLRLTPEGRLQYGVFSSGDEATSACARNIEACRQGTVLYLKIWQRRLLGELDRQSFTCSDGTDASDAFRIVSNNGRRLLEDSPDLVRIGIYSAGGIVLYTGINWAADLMAEVDPTKFSQGLKQYAIWIVGTWLTAHIGADVKQFGAARLVTIANIARRAGALALDYAAVVGPDLQAQCGSYDTMSSLFWSRTIANRRDGMDIEMGNMSPI